MRKLLLTTALLALASPAYAQLRVAMSVGGATFICADGSSCDLNPAPDSIIIGAQALNGVNIVGTFASSTFNPDAINIANLSIKNNSTATQTLFMAVSDNDFPGDENCFMGAVSGTWNGVGPSSAKFAFFVDGANILGASNSKDTPGFQLTSVNSNAGSGPLAFSFNTETAHANGGTPFSLTEGIVFTLAPGAQLVGNSEALTAVPEASTWAMMGLGFVLLGYAGLRRTRRPEAA